MTSKKLRSRQVVSTSDSPASQSETKLKQTKISNWLGSRSLQNCEENSSSESEQSIQSCSSSPSSDSSSEETSTPPRKASKNLKLASHSAGSNGDKSPTIVLELGAILTCDVVNCNYHTSFKANLEKHKKFKHKLKHFKCQECDFSTTYKTSLSYHMKAHQGKLPIKCQLCGWATVTPSSLKYHMKQIHERAERRKQGISRAAEFGKRFKCSKCDFRAVSKQEIHLHNYSHETEKRFNCSVAGCDYRSKTAAGIRQHVKRHDAKKEFQCPLCSKLFWTKYMLHSHIQTHTKELAVPCSICKFVSSSANNLRIHMRKHAEKPGMATNEQNVGEAVSVSSKAESSRQTPDTGRSLQQDQKGGGNTLKTKGIKSPLQPGRKSFKAESKTQKETPATTNKRKKNLKKKIKCQHCDFTATVQSRITRHEVVHRDPDDKLYSCPFPGCNFKTNWEDYLKKHNRDKHKSTPDLVCPVEGCGFQTKWKDNLAQHKQRIHDKKRNRNHQCPLCRKTFYDKNGLTRHINIHTGERKYKCSLCDYAAGESSNFYAHRRKYHPGQECEPIKL